MAEQAVKATIREEQGSTAARRLRQAGQVPAILYGHGETPVALTLAGTDVHAMIESGHHLIDLDVAGTAEKALIKDVQWDTWSIHILHVDFGRVSLDEDVTISVQVWNQGGGTAYAPTQVNGVQPGTDDLVVRMGSGLAIEGTVVGADGKPAVGVFVGATTVEKPMTQTGWIQTESTDSCPSCTAS